jgi:CBS domain-containing protein
MIRHAVGSVLVTDKTGDLQGIFTGRDALRLLSKSPDGASTPLAEAMTHKPVTISPETKSYETLRTMSDGDFRHLPIVHGGKILGVVSRNDFTALDIDRLDEEEHLAECIW